MSTKDNEPQVKKHIILKDFIFNLLSSSRSSAPSPSSSWRSFSSSPSCIRKIAPDSDARAELIRVSEKQEETRKISSNNGGVQVEGIPGEQLFEAEISLGNSNLDPCPNFKYQVDRLSLL